MKKNITASLIGMFIGILIAISLVFYMHTFNYPIKKLPQNLKGSIILLYSKTCPDCIAVKKDLIKFAKMEKVYPIDIKTKDKNELKVLEMVGYTSIPSAVYIPVNSSKLKTYVLYKNINNKVIYDKDVQNNLLILQNQLQ